MEENQYNIGLVSVSFREHTPKEILEEMKKVGLSFIEWGSDVHAPFNDIENLNEIVKMQNLYAIKCSSYGTYFRFGVTPIQELKNYIKAAKILGTNILRLWCGNKNGKNMTREEHIELLSLCRQAAEIAEANNVTLCMECHRDTFTEDPNDAVWLMEQVGSRSFRMYWQPFHWQTPEQNVVNAQRIAPYAEYIHVFNWRDEKRLPLAEAIGDWSEYLKEFSTPRTLLLEFMPNGTLEELYDEVLALKKIIGEQL